MLTVLTWYWRQPGVRIPYTPEHVNIWADSVRRHLSMPHRIACVTDIPEGIDPRVEIIAPPTDFADWRIPSWGPDRPQCLRRIAMFAPDAGETFGERFVCMDLDCVVSGSLDPLFDTPADFKMFRGTAHGRPYNGSMMLLRAGTRPQVYTDFTLEGARKAGHRFVGSDQAWISHCLGPREATWGPEDGALFWEHQRIDAGKCRVVFFPGLTKPWHMVDVGDAFCCGHYSRDVDNGRRCLILGYAPTVWEDLHVALGRDPVFDAVIASPEAAPHWPGLLLGIAPDDARAERLAAMHGFGDVVFCGREGAAA